MEFQSSQAGSASPTRAGSEPDLSRVGGVVSRLREQIASHRIPPGARLREWDVAVDFGVPRLSAREALDALVHLGFVERERNRGIIVRRRDLSEILGLFEMQEVNEGLCARIAARNSMPETWQELIELFGSPMQKIVDHKDLDSYLQNYKKFREQLFVCCGLVPLIDLLERLGDVTSIYCQRLLLVSDRTKQGLEDHRSVLTALRRGDAAEAERLRRATIANVRAAVQQYHAFIL